MILDFRLRPPFGGIENSLLFDANYVEHFSGMFHVKPEQSVYHKSIEMLLEEMESVGCTKGFVPYRYRDGKNDEFVRSIVKYNGKFIGALGVEYAQCEETLNNIEQYVINGPLTAVNMEPSMSPIAVCVDDTSLFYIYEKCQKENISIVLTSNATRPQHFAPERLSHVFDTFPQLKVILTHGCLPWTAAVCQLMYFHKNLYVSPDCYLLGGAGHRDFIDGANTMIPEQIIFGSAYPAVPIGSAIEYYRHCGFRSEVLENVMYHNGMRALGLESESNHWHMEMYY